MKIGLNATCFDDRPSGAKQRFVGIYGQLFRRNTNFDFYVFEPSNHRMASWFGNPENVRFIRAPISSSTRLHKFIQGRLYWRSAIEVLQLDIFENFHLPQINASSGQILLTIHDIRGLLRNESPFGRALYRKVLDKAIESTDHVVTVSKTIQEDLLAIYPDLSCSVIYNGIDVDSFSITDHSILDLVKDKYAIEEKFILAVGHFEKRKNYPILIDAMSHLSQKGTKLNLIIVGNDSGEMDSVQNQIASRGLVDSIKIFSGISDQELRCLYNLADLFVFPSSYEGFGIPILEAMAAECPMTLSDIPVFREITQGRGLYFPHDDPLALADSIENLLSSIEVRQQLINYGRDLVKDFSFSKLSSDLEKVYLNLNTSDS